MENAHYTSSFSHPNQKRKKQLQNFVFYIIAMWRVEKRSVLLLHSILKSTKHAFQKVLLIRIDMSLWKTACLCTLDKNDIFKCRITNVRWYERYWFIKEWSILATWLNCAKASRSFFSNIKQSLYSLLYVNIELLPKCQMPNWGNQILQNFLRMPVY